MVDFVMQHLPWLWVGVLAVSLVVEAATMALTTVWLAIAALPVIFLAFTPLPFVWQLLIFVVLSVALAVFTRPFAIKKLKVGTHDKTNVNSLAGQEVLVTKAVTQFERGEAKAKNGVVWSCTSDVPIEVGAVCTVLSVEGNALKIRPKGAVELEVTQE